MFSRRLHPTRLTPAQLDQFLAQGWYRMNQMIFTVQFIYSDSGLYSPVWLRYDLNQFELSKSLRKIDRKNSNKYRVSIKPFQLKQAHETLFESYRVHFDGNLSPNMLSSLIGENERSIFTTYMVEVFHAEELVAFSVFDTGESSVASITGIYHPDFKSDSLGLYTMIKEIQWAQNQGMQLFYPGYFVPGWPRFDYKLRYGKPDYYDPYINNWRPIDDYRFENIPVEHLRSKLEQARQYFSQFGLKSKLIFYPFFEENLEPLGYDQSQALQFPLVLVLDMHVLNMRTVLLINYDLKSKKFQFCKYTALPLLDLVYTNEHTHIYKTDLVCLAYLVDRHTIIDNSDLGRILTHIRNSK